MIKSFTHKGLEKFFLTGKKAGIQAIHALRLQLILALIDKAVSIEDIDSPGLRLHPWKATRKGFGRSPFRLIGALFFVSSLATRTSSIIWIIIEVSPCVCTTRPIRGKSYLNFG